MLGSTASGTPTSPGTEPMPVDEAYERVRSRYGVNLARAVMRTYKRLLKYGGYSSFDSVSDNYLAVGGDWNQDHLVALQLSGVPIRTRNFDAGQGEGEDSAETEYHYWYSYSMSKDAPPNGTFAMSGPANMTLEQAQQRIRAHGQRIFLSEPQFSRRKPWKQFNISKG